MAYSCFREIKGNAYFLKMQECLIDANLDKQFRYLYSEDDDFSSVYRTKEPAKRLAKSKTEVCGV